MRWYDQDGRIVDWIKNAAGMPRTPTLSDAKKMKLYPSVTGIIDSTLFSHGLENWRRGHLALAAYEAGRNEDDFLMGNIKQRADEIGSEMVAVNNLMHEEILEACRDDVPASTEQTSEYIGHVKDILERYQNLGEFWVMESGVLSRDGYAGTPDCYNDRIIFDWKLRQSVKKTAPKSAVYWENGLQLAAYDLALGGEPRRLINVVFSKNDPTQRVIYEWTTEEKSRLRIAWKHLWNYWRQRTGYRPPMRKAKPDQPSEPTGMDSTPTKSESLPSESAALTTT